MTTLQIPHPSQKELEFWLNAWDKMPNYRNQESALNKLFHRTYPKNTSIDEMLVRGGTAHFGCEKSRWQA